MSRIKQTRSSVETPESTKRQKLSSVTPASNGKSLTNINEQLNRSANASPLPQSIRQSARRVSKAAEIAATPVQNVSVLPSEKTESRYLISQNVSKTLHMKRLSPLFNFTSENFATYSRTLQKYLRAGLQKEEGVAVAQELGVRFAVVDWEGHTSAVDNTENPSYAIVVDDLTASGRNETVFVALLCSSDTPDEYAHTLSLSLPLILMRGSAKIEKHVLEWMAMKFDCCVAPLLLPPYRLAYLAETWMNELVEIPNATKSLKFTFAVPDDVEGIKNIEYTVTAESIKSLKASLDEAHAAGQSESVPSSLIGALQSHFYNTFKIRLAATMLTQVGTPLAAVNNEGVIKFFETPSLRRVIEQLSQMVVE
eukprot:GFYU01003855.1.p1 GENE.GFYU01003855.1~~GFYU01003855.1.p1  ORF type:complete len:367 (+),score=100.91 GFYU01003855.1:196-1296(+)